MDVDKIAGILFTIVGLVAGWVGRVFNNRINKLEKSLEKEIHGIKEEVDDVNIDLRRDIKDLYDKLNLLSTKFNILQGEHKVNHK